MGSTFEDAYSISEKAERKVQYADSREVEAAVLEMFPPKPVPVKFQQDFDDTAIELSTRKRSSKNRTKQ